MTGKGHEVVEEHQRVAVVARRSDDRLRRRRVGGDVDAGGGVETPLVCLCLLSFDTKFFRAEDENYKDVKGHLSLH